MENIMLKFIIMAVILVPAIVVSIIKNRKSVAIFLGFLFVILCSAFISPGRQISIYLLNPYTILAVVGIIGGLYVEMSKRAKNQIYTKESYNDLQSLNRDINAKYSPSIVGILMYGELNEKDLAADIMNLYDNGIINVEKNEHQMYKITLKEGANIENLCESDKYIVDNLIKIDGNFNFAVWSNIVRKQFDTLNFCKEYTKFTAKKLLTMGLIFMIIGAIIGIIALRGYEGIFLGIFGGLFALIAFTIFTVFLDSNKRIQGNLNDNGKAELMKWIKFKNFIKDYTLLNEKNIEDMAIYEKYIPFAVALEVNKNYEDTIYSLFDGFELDKLIEGIDTANNIYKM